MTVTCHPSSSLYTALPRSFESRHDHCLVVLPSYRRLLLRRIQQGWMKILGHTEGRLGVMNEDGCLTTGGCGPW